MINIEKYISQMWLDVAWMVFWCVLLLGIVNFLLWWNQRDHINSSKKSMWIVINVILAGIFFLATLPVLPDIGNASVYTIEDVVKIETEQVGYAKNIYVSTQSGEKYRFDDWSYDLNQINAEDYPGTVVYAKHRRAVLDFIPDHPD